MTKQYVRGVKAVGIALLAVAVTTSGVSAARPAAQPHHSAHAAMITRTIGLSLPFLELKELADGIQRGAQLAVAQANSNHLVPGVTFTIKALDDTVNGKHDGGKDAQNALQFINDHTVIGEVGPLNSSAAKVSEPVYNRAGLAQISPSNTNTDLTNPHKRALFEPGTAVSHLPITYFRTCSTDVYQGRDSALYAKQNGYKSVFVTDNQGTYGIGLAGYFKAEAQKIGLNVLGYAELDPNNITASAQSLAASIAAKKPQLVYFGGEYGPKGGAEILADDIKKAGLQTTFMGGDGIFATDFIKGSQNGGVYGALATNVGLDPTKDPHSKAFLKAEQAMFHHAVEGYDTYAYDAANVILRAFANAVKAGKFKAGESMTVGTRSIIDRYILQTRGYQGATGPVSFDANGDTSNHVFSVYKVVGTGAAAHFQFLGTAPQA